MSTTVEDISSTKKRLKIEIPTDIIEKEYSSSLHKVRQKAKIPGFRPGKVPVNLIEKRFSHDIKADILDRIVPEYYSKALKEAELVPVVMPKFESTLDIKRNEPLTFSLTVEVRPRISSLNYTGLKVEDVDIQIEDKEIEETIKGLQEERAMFDAVDTSGSTGRGIKEDDLLVIDYVKLGASGKKELSSGKDQVMNLGNNLTPKGILEELVGRKKGDVVEISLPSFASADGEGTAASGSLQGKETDEETGEGSRIRITIKEVKEKRLPEIDDEFAKDFGRDTLESLREKIKEGILKAKKDKAEKQQKARLLDMLVESHDFDIPESLLERELENLVVNEKLSMKQSKELINEADMGRHAGYPAAAEKTLDNRDDSEIAGKLKPTAINNTKATILLEMIAEKEGITVTEEELKTRIVLLARQFKATPEAVINLFVTKDGSLENLKQTIRDDKVLDLVLSKAKKV